MGNTVKFEARVECDEGIEFAIEGTVYVTEKARLKEVIEVIKEEVMPQFNQGERQFTNEEIKIKIIK